MKNLFKNPRISFRAAANHNAIAARLFNQRFGARRINHIAISDDRNRNRFFYLTDDIPVCFSGIELCPRSSMHRNRSHTAVLENLCNLHSIRRLFVKSLSNFNCHRLFHCLYHTGHNLPHQRRILHQRGALAVVDDLRHRAAHVKIQNVKRPLLDLCGNLRQNFRITAKKLERYRMFTRMNRHQILGIFVLIQNRLRADHLHTDQACSLLLAENAERQIRHTCHRCEHERILHFHISDFQRRHRLERTFLTFHPASLRLLLRTLPPALPRRGRKRGNTAPEIPADPFSPPDTA